MKQPWFLKLFHQRMNEEITTEEFDEETSTKQLRLDYTREEDDE